MAVKSYTRSCEEKIISGTSVITYFVSKCDIDETQWPQRKTTSGIGDKITYDGDIVLKSGKIWSPVHIITDTGKITHNGEGAETSKAFTNQLEFKLPKDKAADEFMDQTLNFEGVILVREKIGRYRVFGEPGSWATFKNAVGTLAETISGESSWINVIGDSTGKVAPIYEGIIQTEIAGDFNNDFNNDFS